MLIPLPWLKSFTDKTINTGRTPIQGRKEIDYMEGTWLSQTKFSLFLWVNFPTKCKKHKKTPVPNTWAKQDDKKKVKNTRT